MTRTPFAALLALATSLLPLVPPLVPSLGTAAALSSAPAAAQELVQLHLWGAAAAPPSEAGQARGFHHGHLVEIEIVAVNTSAVSTELILHLHVASGTTGYELLQVVAGRLDRLGIPATLTGGAKGSAAPSRGSLWIESAKRVHIRLGAGLSGEIACAEGPPAAIKIHPCAAIQGEATVLVAASTAMVLPGRRPLRGRATFRTSLKGEENSAEAATVLWKAATEKWVSDRPGTDAWRPIKMTSGETITGVSVYLAGTGDWGLEVTL